MKARNMLRDTVRNAGPVKRHAVTTESRFEDALARMAAIRAGLPYFELKGLDPDDVARPDLDGCPPEIVEEHVAAAPAAGERIRFTDIISPFSTGEFFARRHAHPHPLLLHGPSGRFGSLVEWKDLDDLICRGRLKAHDLRLVLDGTHIPPNLFSMVPYGRSTRQLEQVPPVVDDRKLVSFLRQGATLIVDRIHGHLPAVADLGHAFETALHNYALVNLYVSWQATRGFATHWDGHDVFVLQVRGEKRWYLYGPTRRSPTSEDTAPARSAPGTPVWEGTLRPGDVFFVPRGWWHDARMSSAQGGAGSIHLTCHVRPVTGQHLLVWLGGKLAQHELFRKGRAADGRGERAGAVPGGVQGPDRVRVARAYGARAEGRLPQALDGSVRHPLRSVDRALEEPGVGPIRHRAAGLRSGGLAR